MRLTVSVASLVTLALLTACGGGSVVEPQPQAPIAVGPSATESPAESPSFATRALKIPRATAMQTPSIESNVHWRIGVDLEQHPYTDWETAVREVQDPWFRRNTGYS